LKLSEERSATAARTRHSGVFNANGATYAGMNERRMMPASRPKTYVGESKTPRFSPLSPDFTQASDVPALLCRCSFAIGLDRHAIACPVCPLATCENSRAGPRHSCDRLGSPLGQVN